MRPASKVRKPRPRARDLRVSYRLIARGGVAFGACSVVAFWGVPVFGAVSRIDGVTSDDADDA
jgi:hypothetical protein